MRKYQIKPQEQWPNNCSVFLVTINSFTWRNPTFLVIRSVLLVTNSLILKKKSICKVYNFTFILKDLPLGIESQVTVGHGSARLQSQSLEGTGRMGLQVILGYRRLAWSPASSQHRGQCYLEQFSDCARRWLHCWSQKLWGSSAPDGCRAHGARLWHSPVCGAAGWCRVVSSWELGIFLLT